MKTQERSNLSVGGIEDIMPKIINEKDYLVFRGRPLVREGDTICYGNLNTDKYVACFPWKRKGVTTGETNSGAVQGLCVYDDRIYVTSGAKNDEATLMSVMDFNGNILQKLVKVGVSADKQQLIKLNLSSDGTFEPEGLHIHGGQMYLGFVGDYPTSGSKKHTCVIKLK